MIHQAVHYIEPGLFDTPCGRDSRRVAITGEPTEVTCKQCLHKLNAPKFVGQNRNRDQYQVRCVGGPWDGQDVVLPRQDSSHVNAGLSLPIRVGEHVGRYNLNTGTWVPKEKS
jgi:hypothetical protein